MTRRLVASAGGVLLLSLCLFIFFDHREQLEPIPQPHEEPMVDASSPPLPAATRSASHPEQPAHAHARHPEADFERPATEEVYWSELEKLQRTDKENALVFALKGDEWYSPTGKPAEARRAMIVTLMVDLGRMEEARVRTRDFISQYPNSPYRRLVQGVTGIHPRPGAPPGHR